MAFVVFVIRGDPVLGTSFLGCSNIDLPTADHVADEPLQSVFGLSIPFRFDAAARLRP